MCQTTYLIGSTFEKITTKAPIKQNIFLDIGIAA
jgi:hypothetical protein